jgi:hypothetical protein
MKHEKVPLVLYISTNQDHEKQDHGAYKSIHKENRIMKSGKHLSTCNCTTPFNTTREFQVANVLHICQAGYVKNRGSLSS